MREDATRNRSAILAAARTAMSARGEDFTMGEVAAGAGVAVGTLYRHFTDKHDLVVAVVDETLHEVATSIVDAADEVAAGGDPVGVFDGLFRGLAARHSGDQAWKAAAQRLGVPVPGPEEVLRHPAGALAADATERLVAALHAAGVLAAPIDPDDLVVLLDGAPAEPERRDRYVDTVLRGLLLR